MLKMKLLKLSNLLDNLASKANICEYQKKQIKKNKRQIASD